MFGIIYDPMLDRLLVGIKGQRTYLNGKRINVSTKNSFDRAFINLDCEKELVGLKADLVHQAWVSTLFSAVYASLLVACGEFEAEIFEFKNPWDAAAVKIIVEEAGGKVTDLDGKDQRYDQRINGFIASNGILHDQIVQKVQKIRKNSK